MNNKSSSSGNNSKITTTKVANVNGGKYDANLEESNDTPATILTPELIQQYLDENALLIRAIEDAQEIGAIEDALKYQSILQRNLTYLATIANSGSENKNEE